MHVFTKSLRERCVMKLQVKVNLSYREVQNFIFGLMMRERLVTDGQWQANDGCGNIRAADDFVVAACMFDKSLPEWK